MAYFNIANGLRGCYMPDNSYVAQFNTRKELKRFVEYEAMEMIEAYGFGFSKRDRATIVAQIWKEVTGKQKKSVYPYAIGFGSTRDTSNRPYGLMIGHATRAEFIEYCKEENMY